MTMSDVFGLLTLLFVAGGFLIALLNYIDRKNEKK